MELPSEAAAKAGSQRKPGPISCPQRTGMIGLQKHGIISKAVSLLGLDILPCNATP